ncbi:MAG: hypothetical protein J0H64_05915 [Actinobacteria bacterium]|nr:hypothetical protein [Actinomycetota bacterium]
MNDYVPHGLFWVSLALINAGLAEQKNRSRLAWFLLSLLLGPIATFFIVGMSRPAPASAPAQPQSLGSSSSPST